MIQRFKDRSDADALACIRRPSDLFAIRARFDHFAELSDWEAGRIVERPISERGAAGAGVPDADYGTRRSGGHNDA